MARRLDLPIGEVARRYEAGAPLRELADRLGISTGTVRARLGAAGVELRRPGAPRREVDLAELVYETMARPPLPLGTYGNTSVRPTDGGGYVAQVRFRDADGVTVASPGPVERRRSPGTSSWPLSATEPALTAARVCRAESKFREAADVWLASIEEGADTGELSENTAQLYGLQLRNHVLPALGALRLREVTTPRVDDFLRATRIGQGSRHGEDVPGGRVGRHESRGSLRGLAGESGPGGGAGAGQQPACSPGAD